MRAILGAAVAASVLSACTFAFAGQYRVGIFDGSDGVATSLWLPPAGSGSAAQVTYGGSNTGAEQNPGHVTYLNQASEVNGFPVALYRPVLPADLAGATVVSAQFIVAEVNVNGGTGTAVELRRINLAGSAPWDPGDGKRADRSTTVDNGAQMFWADFDKVSNSGITWSGQSAAGPWNGGSATDFRTTAMADLINTQTVSSGATVSWDVRDLVQHWANGDWDNDGFSLICASTDSTLTKGFRFDTAGSDTRGLIIDYTAVPEPSSLGLLVLGAVAVLRRRMS